MTTLKFSLFGKKSAQTREAIAGIVLSRPDEDGSEGDNPCVYFIRGIACGKIMSS